jgi:NAD-dependent deacetylase
VDNEAVRQAAEIIKAASRVVVLTGAGISQESGVPTFRGKDGLWRQYRAEQLATLEAFQSNPQLVWEWYDWRRSLIKPLAPNPGHYALVELEKRIQDLTLVTQNVDGLHRMAGSTNPIEMHGTIWRVRCMDCNEIFENRDVPIKILPTCEVCGGLLRPDVVWFGEALDEKILRTIYTCLQQTQLMLIVGTSAVVQPAASFGLVAKRTAGASVIELNRSKTAQSSFFDLSIQGNAGELLPRLLDYMDR